MMAVINGSSGSVSVRASMRANSRSVLVSRMPCVMSERRMSERWIDHVVNVALQNRRIDRWKSLSAPAELVKRDGWPWEAGELGDGRASVSDRQPLPALSALDDLAAPVAEIADRHICHPRSVSPVRRMEM